MANIASVIVQADAAQVVVMAHNREGFNDDEWEEGYLRYIREVKERAGVHDAANLVFAEGKGPNSKQRIAGNAIFGGQKDYQFKVAVVTEAVMVRAAVSALSWFNPLIKAYSPPAWRQAFAHVRFREQHHARLLGGLRTLKENVPDVGVLNDVLGYLASDVQIFART